MKAFFSRRATSVVIQEDDDKAMNVLASNMDATLRALKAHEEHLSPQRKNKWKQKDDNDFSLDMKRQF